PLINKTLASIWGIGRSGGLPVEIAEIEFFVNAEDNEILLEMYLAREAEEETLQIFAEGLKASVKELSGIPAFAGTANQPAKMLWSFGKSELIYRTAADAYHVRAGSFFQTNRYLTEELV